jgi:hypothetical protein
LCGFQFLRKRNGELLFARYAMGLGGLSLEVLQRHDAHADQVATMDALVAFSNDGTDVLK